ncbi:MAG: 4-hydroxythreonine-4-phosphate dehydrogenase PdxA [Planctomycetaceae bacterium]
MNRPRLAVTMGDVAGIGPEIVVRAATDPRVLEVCRPVVIGHPEILRRAIRLVGSSLVVDVLESKEQCKQYTSTPGRIPCLCPGGMTDDILSITNGRNDPRAGDAAFRSLMAAIDGAQSGAWEGIVTAPLSKAALHLAGHFYPGHTEILAERCGVTDFGMMLYIPPSTSVRSPHGIGVVHVTLHTSLASVPPMITQSMVREKIGLVDAFMRKLGVTSPRIAVNALNPHAGESGLFGREEIEIISPAVEECRRRGLHVTGPIPADTLYRQAVAGHFDAVVAMYHDQGHIPFKLIGAEHAVNVTLGLPIVRTSPSHGTAFDIAWQGKANAEGLIEAILVAAQLAE